MVKLSDIQVYIIVVITGSDNLQTVWVVGFGGWWGFFFALFLYKESNIFCQTDIYLMKEEYINVCTFQVFLFNYLSPKHLPENNIPL